MEIVKNFLQIRKINCILKSSTLMSDLFNRKMDIFFDNLALLNSTGQFCVALWRTPLIGVLTCNSGLFCFYR